VVESQAKKKASSICDSRTLAGPCYGRENSLRVQILKMSSGVLGHLISPKALYKSKV
jgi:hypothetical protein